MRRCARRLVHVHDRRRTPVTRPRPTGPSPCARRSCGCASSWATCRRGSPRSASRSASRSTACRRSLAQCWPPRIDEFGKYPMNKGLDEFCAAAAAWLGRRFALPRPVDPATEVLVLNGSREGLFLAGIAAERWAKGRAGRPAILMPNPFYGAYEAGAVAAHAEPVYPAGDRRRPASCPTSIRCPTSCSRARSPSISPRPPTRRARSRARTISRGSPRSRAVTASSCSATSAIPKSTRRRRRPACSSMPGATSRTWSCSSRCRSARTCPACASASSPATASSSPASSNCATSRRRRCRCRRSASRSRPMRTRRMSRRAGALYVQKFDLADQILGDRYGYRRPAGGFLLWLDVSAHGGDEAVTLRLWTRSRPARHPRQLSRARTGRRLQSRRGLYPRRHRAGPRHHGRGAASPRRGAGLRIAHVGHRPRFRQPQSLRQPARGAAAAHARTGRRCADRAGDAAGRRARARGRCRIPRSAMPPMRRCATCSASPAPSSPT